ncbi:hypothetical protein G9F72_007360 [Clostridium estertheticum]|uniref:hypothetical protein n=1 Tax=Clostridium estertheticum TaxID=238834 RepID=UPI0013E912AD|nr:hypothetical protein [Clostridium estertheticum]MBZ9686148.1 hypothetical protein [Clostridium estertheticum]
MEFLFAYCSNDCVNTSDPTGFISVRKATLLIDGLIMALNFGLAIIGVRGTYMAWKYLWKEAAKNTKKKLITMLKGCIGSLSMMVVGFSIPGITSIVGYACEWFLNGASIGSAIAVALDHADGNPNGDIHFVRHQKAKS